MSDMQFTVNEAPRFGPDVRHYRIACAHGASSALLVPGRKPLQDLAVLDFLLAGHHARRRCTCVPGMPALVAEARA